MANDLLIAGVFLELRRSHSEFVLEVLVEVLDVAESYVVCNLGYVHICSLQHGGCFLQAYGTYEVCRRHACY